MRILNEKHFNSVKAHAESVGFKDQFQSRINRLKELAGDGELTVGYDFAPYSLTFSTDRIGGGLIYSPGSGWSIHT